MRGKLSWKRSFVQPPTAGISAWFGRKLEETTLIELKL
jgi:hypothetical protein